MRILEKQGDEISIIALPSETVFQGDYLEIVDNAGSGSIIVQVYEEMYVPSQSFTEDIIRDQIIEASATGTARSFRDFQRIPDGKRHAPFEVQDSR